MYTDFYEQGPAADEILAAREGDAPIEAWTPDDFDHYSDIGLVRAARGDDPFA